MECFRISWIDIRYEGGASFICARHVYEAMVQKGASKEAKQHPLSQGHKGVTPLREGPSKKKMRRAPDAHNLPLCDTYLPDTALDITNPVAIEITLPPKDHKLSEWNSRRIFNSQLPTADRAARYPADFGQKGTPNSRSENKVREKGLWKN